MFPVIKGSSYILVHTPSMVLHNGTTQTLEREMNPNSEYLKKVPSHLRSFKETVEYAANQAYIGNILPDDLNNYQRPWYQNLMDGADRFGKFGEIMPEDEFAALIKISDAFDLVKLEESFLNSIKDKVSKHPMFKAEDIEKLKGGVTIEEIEKLVNEQHAEALYVEAKLVGCVKRAHDKDVNLNAHIMFENLVVKASGILALKHLVEKSGVDVNEIEYVVECSEEACGDMNQRGGGNFAKGIAESAGLKNATGSDLRAFCAAPTHALIEAAALVQAGVYKYVAVVAGGATAKLGMNGKDHVAKGLPILEDTLGGFAVLVGPNDGQNPVVRTDLVGRHTVGTGSSPQAVITALITNPLDKGGLKIVDIDKYSVEMQNPEITEPAGAGDVPTSNYKMIAALGVKRGDLDKAAMNDFIKNHGMPGFAPTQGHIPSGVPFIGACREMMLDGKINKSMIVGKGSLFLARMTNQFDGVSVVIEANSGKTEDTKGISEDRIKQLIAGAMKEFATHLLGE
jgi:glycine/sarcosine/betaine reductase complex component C subunit beta